MNELVSNEDGEDGRSVGWESFKKVKDEKVDNEHLHFVGKGLSREAESL